jgi:hypothetical protein
MKIRITMNGKEITASLVDNRKGDHPSDHGAAVRGAVGP